MSSHLGVKNALELLNTLKATVSEFAAREEKLTRESRVRAAAENQRHQTGVEELDSRLAREIGEAEAAFQATKDRIQAIHAWRKARIAQAHKASLKRRLDQVEDKEGRRKYELQRGLMQRDRTREAETAQAETTLADFKARLAETQETLADLEERARNSFRGFAQFRRLLEAAPSAAEAPAGSDEYQLFDELGRLLSRTTDDLNRFRKLFLPLCFRLLSIWLFLVMALVVPVGLVPILRHFGTTGFAYPHAAGVAAGLIALALVLHQTGRRRGQPAAAAIATALHKARRLHDSCFQLCDTRHTQDLARIAQEYLDRTQQAEHAWDLARQEAAEARATWPRRIDEKEVRVSERNEQLQLRRYEYFESQYAETAARLQAEADARRQQLLATHQAKSAQLDADQQAQWRTLTAEWRRRLQPLYATLTAAQAAAAELFPAWSAAACENWTPPATFVHAAQFAQMRVEVEKLAETFPKDPRLALPGPAQFTLPLLLTYPDQGSLLIETVRSGREQVVESLNNLILRLLSVAPPGRLHFTVIDPVGLGQNFAGVMHLADYEESLINSRIWTQTTQIEQRLADLSEHMEKVIQMYLRNEYATIAEYNEQAGNIAEKYHFLVVADFPAGFSDIAAKRLLNIATSGARCGVFTLIHWDRRLPALQDVVPDELKKSSVGVASKGPDFILTTQLLPGVTLLLDPPPTPEVATAFIHKIGQASKDSNRVEVPFDHVAPSAAELWTGDTTSELRVPVGRTGATKLQYLAIGKGTCQHALVAGKTGSGKSTLFHVIITNLALWCSPEQVEFYLVDFKKGVEFKCYASKKLPHARVIAIESDREFGLSVLQRLDDELKRRGDMFRHLGVQDIAGYKRAGGTEPVPRSLLLIDEFQEFFVEDDKIAQTASVLLDRIVRQGRAFGIHVLLGSQTLGGAYTLARATLGQMVIRIALQCNEADAYLIMDENNPAPRLLSRPGEGIYNDTAGTLEGNSPFQVVWLPDEVRDANLDRVLARAAQAPTAYAGPIVFEGNAPADVRENPLLKALLEAPAIQPPTSPRIWLGAPNSIKGPTEALFHHQSGNHLLLVGQRDDATLAILSTALVALAAQYPRGQARFFIFDGNPPESSPREYLQRVVDSIPHDITLAKYSDTGDLINRLATDLKAAGSEDHVGTGPVTFVFLPSLQKFKKLHYQEDFSFSLDESAAPNPGAQLQQIITEGARLGFHLIVTCDTYNNVSRCLGRKALTEFELRVLFQMSANDSASLVDSPKASTLGLHRALFYNEQEGYLETFRPYALPGGEWIELASRQLHRLHAAPP